MPATNPPREGRHSESTSEADDGVLPSLCDAMGGRRVEGGAERRQEAVEAYRAALSVFRLAIGDEQTNVREWRTRVAQN